jgi:hypothetical protein
MEERGLAASTSDRRLTCACGCYRFAHIDGRISSNPAQFVRRPRSTLGAAGPRRRPAGALSVHRRRVDHALAALVVLLGLNGLRSERRATPTSRTQAWSGDIGCSITVGKGDERPHPAGAAHRPHHRSGHRRAPGRSDPARRGRPSLFVHSDGVVLAPGMCLSPRCQVPNGPIHAP